MAKYSIWGIANKIKVESLDKNDKVRDSIFGEVYKKADRLFFEIIREMQQLSECECIWDDQIANVISFLGGRGRGKTSAMLSFYFYLGNLKLQEKEDAWGEWKNLKDKPIRFVEIPCIDAAALAQSEFIIEVILAKMWDNFDIIIKENPYVHDSHLECLLKSVRKRFVNVHKAYTILREKETDKKREEDISAASALHELAASMNFKEEFKQLVQEYIQVLNYDQYNRRGKENAGYLVFAIDDIDMAGSRAQSILEQIRRFLSIPQVVILLTADIERLKDVCEKYYQRVYPEGRNLHKFVSEYLEKVLPINQRIYMPELSENQKEVAICKDERKNVKLRLRSDKEKEMILELLAKKCGIYFDGLRRRRHFLQNDSLRGLVNYFNSIADLDNEEYTAWLKNDLQERIVERIENEKQKEFVKILLTKDYEDVNNFVLRFIKTELKDNTALRVKDNSMGQVLYACSLMEDEGVENVDFVNCILMLYGIMMGQVNSELREEIVGNSIWGEWEYGTLGSSATSANFITGLDNRAALEFRVSELVDGHIRDHQAEKALGVLLKEYKDEILGWLYAMSFVNFRKTDDYVFEVDEKRKSENTTAGNDDEASKVYEIKPMMRATKSYFGCLCKDSDIYKDALKRLWRGALRALGTKVFTDAGEKPTDEVLDKIEKQYMVYIDEMEIEENSKQLSLLQNVEMIYSIGREIEKDSLADVAKADKAYERMASRYNIIKVELHRRDQYYKNKVKIETDFEQEFIKRFQAKIFLEPTMLSHGIKKAFISYFEKLFRITAPSINKM